MAKPSRFNGILRTVTKDVMSHPRDLTRYYAEKFGITRPAANKYIQKLESEGWIARSGPSTHPVFSPGYKRRVSGLYPLEGLEEDMVWEYDFRPYFNLSTTVHRIVNHGFTEMVNNAVDHSEGKSVFIWMSQDEGDLSLIISDNGIGIFNKITLALGLPDMRQALFELAKGKFTTDPSKHSGEGVFFTSRIFDMFEISANGLQFNHHDHSKHDWLEEREATGVFKEGTLVHMRISLSSQRQISEVFDQYTEAPEDYGFSKTVVPMKMARLGDEQLISRSQAKRLIARFEHFKVVILNFDGIQEIGQAFADELFRVYAKAHPEVSILAEKMSPQVERMWLRAVSPTM